MSKLALPFAAVLFAAWAVYLGGLASLQWQCADDNGSSNMQGINGINASQPCHKVYRLYWFYLVWELCVIVAIAAAAVTGRISHLTAGFVGLLSVATVMFIQASNTFLQAEDLDYYDSDAPQNRLRTTTAGAIMVALLNAVGILVLGYVQPAQLAGADKPMPPV